jgi:Tol biopolymer transport system component
MEGFRRWDAAILASILIICACGSTDPAQFSSTAVIYFGCSDANALSGICRISPNGSGFRRIVTALPGNRGVGAPASSPDASTIAYNCASQNGESSAICLMAPDGSDNRIVIDTLPDSNYPTWSPDGRLAFARTGEIWVSNADGSNQVQLTHFGGGFYLFPDWSPNGQSILFSTGGGGGTPSGLWIIDADGSNLRLLIDLPGDELEMRWSPDGTKVLFAMSHELDLGGKTDLFVYDLATQETRRLTTFGTVNSPAWSPDGAYIAFQGADQYAASQLYIMNTDGSNPASVTSLSQAKTASLPDWVEGP